METKQIPSTKPKLPFFSLVAVCLVLVAIGYFSANIAYRDPVVQGWVAQPQTFALNPSTPPSNIHEPKATPDTVVANPLNSATTLPPPAVHPSNNDLNLITFNFAGTEHAIKLSPDSDPTDAKAYKYTFQYENIKGFAGLSKVENGLDNIIIGGVLKTKSYDLMLTGNFDKNVLFEMATTQKGNRLLFTMDLVKGEKVLVRKHLAVNFNWADKKIDVTFLPTPN